MLARRSTRSRTRSHALIKMEELLASVWIRTVRMKRKRSRRTLRRLLQLKVLRSRF